MMALGPLVVSTLFEENKGRFDVDLGTIHHMPTPENPVYAKEMHLPAGYFAVSHKHAYDHISHLSKGRVLVEVDGASSNTYTAPAFINIRAGLNHKITALEDVTWFCIHATNETDIKKIDQVLIKED